MGNTISDIGYSLQSLLESVYSADGVIQMAVGKMLHLRGTILEHWRFPQPPEGL